MTIVFEFGRPLQLKPGRFVSEIGWRVWWGPFAIQSLNGTWVDFIRNHTNLGWYKEFKDVYRHD